MPYHNNGSDSGPQSAEQLADELKKCTELQETMKAVNAYWRKTGTCVGAPEITEALALKLDDKIATTHYSWEKQPYSSYDLTNNNSRIKRLERKVKEVSRGFTGWEFAGGEAVANNELGRLQLFFDEKPGDKERSLLKANGFKWAPSQGAWQRQITDNAIYAAGRLDFLKPLDGRTVREHQPAARSRNDGAR
jgi:hypothetical protein